MIKDTIAAISTGMTNSGIGKVRMSGPQALEIADKVYRSPKGKTHLLHADSHTIHYGYIYDGEQLIDEVLVLIMRAPRSYTTEDMVEIDCHGGVVVMKKILETAIKYGARPAEPGEFTKRAFLNGRIDLTQAEAVIDVINAKNEYALSSSVKQLRGNVLEKIRQIRKNIIGNVAFIEAAMDDPEHINADDFGEELKVSVEENIKAIQKLLDSADNGRMIREGIKTVIVGKPNAGKSSLLNSLVGDERAIVTDIAGTTRDTLEESINIHGIPLNIVDTAGIRETQDVVEKIGVTKAKTFAQDADLIIYVVDGSTPLDENDREIMDMIRDKKAVILLNKIDLDLQTTKEMLENMTQHPVLEISAANQQGLEDFEALIRDMFFGGKLSFNDEIYITNIRHKEALSQALESLNLVLDSICAGMPEDFFSIDLMNAYDVLGGMIGESAGEDLIDTIFSDFCMGK
ncbi:MAG TPA: tRNA uridine-5-carboxymethylaminomethyl(34) synthesis GTPase MnmE [Candidatus Scybalocola faecigallinarum]|uniref:tRNA modification GTPase MnmE n=1 Tax=Candidatus Scybalocola faecigallinarum TaxID=2840941 RepID=A0A9D1JPK4_9FIRM|nr:tRNA uridine-5-carboxymethylaminomethyl(34) synthesis GTPase MnmE [Candidatus Scybalocola faecigallinarum]